MDIIKLIDEWIAVSNSYDTDKYLTFYAENAIFDDPSVGRKFNGKTGIKEYFNSYLLDIIRRLRKLS